VCLLVAKPSAALCVEQVMRGQARDILLAILAISAPAIAAIAPALSGATSSALAAASASPGSSLSHTYAPVATSVPKWTPPPSPVPTMGPNPALPSAGPSVPRFAKAAAPYGLALGATCVVQESFVYADELGGLWRIQCGSAAANLTVAAGADAQGWHFENGDRPEGFQNFTQGDLLMQVVYRRDGPAAADPVTVVQKFIQPTSGAAMPDGLPLTLSPRCSLYGAPIQGDATSRTWQGRCGGDMATAFDDAFIGGAGFKPMPASLPPYQARAWCGATQVTVRWGAGLAAGTFLFTQTRIPSPGVC
jgi:hypothetical protein